MGPVLEDAAIHCLRTIEVLTAVIGDSRVEDVVMTPLDHVNRVDLYVPEMPHRRGHGRRAATKRRIGIEPLRVQPDGLGESASDPGGQAARSQTDTSCASDHLAQSKLQERGPALSLRTLLE